MIFFVCLIRISSLITNSGNKFVNKQIVIFDMINLFFIVTVFMCLIPKIQILIQEKMFHV